MCFSSFQKFPASNLILCNDKKTGWKCRDQGEKRAFVILELEHPTEINGIDIGNDHSCFIEVQVGRRGDSEGDFKELVLTSSFQTPAESRNSENTNRVRCFNKTTFVESTAGMKWELIKLICTQPFNSRVQYGISFLTIYTAEEVKAAAAAPAAVEKKKGVFSIREPSPDSDVDSSTLFSRWKQSKQGGGAAESNASPSRVSAAAAIRDARTSIGERKSPMLLTPSAAKKRPSTESPAPALDRNRNNLLYDDSDDEKGDDKLEQLIEKDKKRAEEQLKKENPKKEKAEKPAASTPAKKFKFSDNKKDGDEDKSASTSTPSRPTKEKETADPEPKPAKPKKPKTYKPFKRLLEGVVLTISGIQNPERGNLRSKALEMGAKYKGDWDDNCTHLICAFRNTPKYNQVQGIGKIVKKEWVLQCHASKRHIPWRRYALDNKQADKSESEDEIWDEAEKDKEETGMTTEDDQSQPIAGDEKDKEEEDDDILMVYDQVEAPVIICDSGSDTEDEIEKVRTETVVKGLAKESPKEKAADDVPPPKEREKESAAAESLTSFKGKKFYLDEDNGVIKIIKCHTIITKFGG